MAPDFTAPVLRKNRLQTFNPLRNFGTICWAILVGAGILVMAIASFTLHTVKEVQVAAMTESIEFNTKVVIADEARTRHIIATLDKILVVIRADFLSKRLVSRDDLIERINQLSVQEDRNPNAVIMDARGNLLIATANSPTGKQLPLNLADRDYFKSQQTANSDELQIGVPIQSRITGEWVIPLTRRMTNPDGSLGGVIFMSLDPAVFTDSYKAISLGKNASHAIIGLDGFTRVRRDNIKISYGDDARKSQVFNEIKLASAGTYTGKAAVDGVVRAVSYRVIEPYALVIVSASSVGDILASVAGQIQTARVAGALGSGLVVLSAVILIVSILRQRKAFENLADSAARYQGLFEQTPVMHVITETSGTHPTILECNQKFAVAMRYSREALIGKKISELLSPDSPGYHDLHQNLQSVAEGATLLEPRTLLTKDGRKLYVLVQMTPDSESDAEKVNLRATMVDITRSESLRAALFNSEQNFKQLLELIPQLVMTMDAQSKLTWVNERTVDYIGATNAQSKTDFKWMISAVHPEDQASVRGHLAAAISSRTTSGYCEFRLRASDGEYRWFTSQVTPIMDDEGHIIQWLKTCIDIHERKMADERMRVVRKVETIGQLTGGLAHDFNNLLAIVIGNLDMVTGSITDAKGAHRIKVALGAAERGAELVKSLLALASKQPLLPSHTELGALLERLAPLLRHALGVRVKLAMQTSKAKIYVQVDVAGLEAALLNLAINARDAMPEGGSLAISLDILMPVATQEGDATPMAFIAFKDTGTGMTEEVLRRAQEPFFTTKERGQGTGLGLSMVAGFVKQSRGELTIQSTVGQGCTIEIFLPMTGQHDLPEHLTPVAEKTKPQSGVILVVDDQAEVALVLCDWAEELGYATLTANSAQNALSLLAKTPVDLVISDIAMPGDLDGIGLADVISKRYPEINVLLMSGYSKETATARTDVPWTVLVKPFRKPELQSAIETHLSPGVPQRVDDWCI
ncbi:MAG: PAS domain S-box protein [Rhodoferax sp.]|uniref:PAS domain S-box protein n=1 Tax=Rhodoferax sp. TaxID=50421 RepID=UPI00301ABCE8